MTKQEFCKITYAPALNYTVGNVINYQVKLGEDIYNVSFCKKCHSKIDFNAYRHVLAGLLLNNKLDGEVIHFGKNPNDEGFDFKQYLDEASYPISPNDKLNNLFLDLAGSLNYEGQRKFFIANNANLIWFKYYFKNQDEFIFYFKMLEKKGLVKIVVNNAIMTDTGQEAKIHYDITFEGLNYAISLTENGQNSNYCFLAMSFSNNEKINAIRTSIKAAILESGFIPLIVDEENINSDQTINDRIIANLKKCKFCIADFTGQSKGVYFESGFALGQGKKVIYTCEMEDFKNAHFDIKPLQHIIYSSPDELKRKLIDKIEAWVK